jgi:protein TonB
MSTSIEDAFNMPDLPTPEATAEGFDAVPFVAYDNPPQVATMVNPNYPELARRAGIECDVYVEAVINTNGKVDMVRVSKSTCGQTGCDEEALKAVKQWTFTPAKQRDTPVRVRYMVPVRFRLKQ